ncbi:MAG TPA: RsmD family RNA methyltransferase, partial [Candidatus Limnocylindrales bacterium]|nr:RsmD family RNA methyltransferase [Candidatus Limnocylindrales bacterium]
MADAGRVIAGTARGIRLEAPGPGTRPLGDRVKQTLFAMLEPDLPGARTLDLFAGSGAAGIEALSRGAGHVTFVERDPAAIRVIAANLTRTHLADR